MAPSATIALVDAPNALAAAVVLPVVCAAVVALRFYTRYRQRAERGPDDWLTIPALVLLAGMSACIITSVELGLDQYLRSNETGFVAAAQSLWSFQLLLYPAHCLIKLSILFFYRRLFFSRHVHWMNAHQLFKASCVVTGFIIVIWAAAFFLLNILDCGNNVALNWAPLPIYIKSCPAGITLERAFAVSDLVIDLILLLLPMPTVWRGNLPRPRKIAVSAVLVLGFASLGASIPRLILYMAPVDISGLSHPSGPDEFTPLMMQLWRTMMYWSIIEANLALIAACLPTLWSLLPSRLRARRDEPGDDASSWVRSHDERHASRSRSRGLEREGRPRGRQVREINEVIKAEEDPRGRPLISIHNVRRQSSGARTDMIPHLEL